MEYVFRMIYRVPKSPKRKRERPLRVLCLGVARTGTESLRTALLQLRYQQVSHGFVWWLHNALDSAFLDALAVKKLRNESITTEDFDQVFGNYDVLVDVPAIWFATDLLKAYPDAKVVLNRRKDVHEWKRSFRESILPMMTSWEYWWTSWFHTELFWSVKLTDRMWMQTYFGGDSVLNAERAYERHYHEIEELLKAQKRVSLDWTVQDGWGPMCQFLEKNAPDVSFPQTNVAAEFVPKLMAADKTRMRRARRNASICGVIFVLVVAVVWSANFS
ncbi:hypothetical protein LTR24_010722 [Lithohypha guttulata]|uniref:P-loop containing nucleoside triphosphate hydrolase protein n=1 Tax=Lithohypha guttulata TaxID=1690604 RepID=A0ABR0JTE0_9EURO|nr:hypothetical protein LTR24_010722 [Lithohypha guttulata]